ncbi:MAG: ThiF family adenylyltransferase [Candidatus Parvarchaeota archaeon]|nr:ThiF family adenylyltransferase [Candidatus Parvarchaeota archaeon]
MENKSILVIGAGAVGSAFLESSQGIFKKVGIFDGDIISKSNLITQPFYKGCDFSSPVSKVAFAVNKLNSLNSGTEYEGYERYFTEKDFETMKEYDIIADFTDNVNSRKIINNGCVKYRKAAVFVSLNEKEAFLFFYRESACFNCLFRNSIGHVKEGCESIVSAPKNEFVSFLKENIIEFASSKIDGGRIMLFNLSNKRVLSSMLKKDMECEVCVKHAMKNFEDGFLQVCSSGIKFSYGKKLNLKELSSRLSGGILYGEYLIFNQNNKSMLVSLDGDFLFTGYSREEAGRLITALVSQNPKHKE